MKELLVDMSNNDFNEINKYLDVLEAEGKIESIWQDRGMFYQVSHK